LAELFCDC